MLKDKLHRNFGIKVGRNSKESKDLKEMKEIVEKFKELQQNTRSCIRWKLFV